MISFKKLLTVLLLSFTVVVAQPPLPIIREHYDQFLSLFKKRETAHSFSIFKDNFVTVYLANGDCSSNRYYLTQHSDVQFNHYYISTAVYIYLLDSRKQENKNVLICA